MMMKLYTVRGTISGNRRVDGSDSREAVVVPFAEAVTFKVVIKTRSTCSASPAAALFADRDRPNDSEVVRLC
jgi:hypothetical protein